MELNEKEKAFERCADFLASMIEKYGAEVLAEINIEKNAEAEEKTEEK